MIEFYYSINEEDYIFEGFDEAVEHLVAEGDNVGEVRSIFKGKVRSFTASDFLRFDPEDMNQNASDEVGEHADGWPTCTKEEEDGLTTCIKEAVEAWATENNRQPKFFGVTTVEEITIKITDENGTYERVA